MLAQIFCGNLTGQVTTYGLHVFFRCLSAVSCAQMYTAGQMICKLNTKRFMRLNFKKYRFYTATQRLSLCQ